MSLPWIKLFADLPDHPRAEQLAWLLGVEEAWHHLTAMWLWCSRYAEEGRLSGVGCERLLEKGARWRGQPGAFVEAAIATGWLARSGDGFLIVGWEKHQLAHLEKKERDRIRAAKNRARRAEAKNVAEKSRDASSGVRDPSADDSRTVAGEKEKEKEIDPPPTPPPRPDDDDADDTSVAAEAPTPGAVETHVVATSEAPDRGLARRRARRRWSGPATGEVLDVWSAWLDWCEPGAVWSDERGALIAEWLDQGVPAAKLVRAIEGYAGDPYWRGEGRRHRTLERVLAEPAALERGWTIREGRDWRDPRRRQQSPPARASPPTPAPRPPDALRPPEELGGIPEFLRVERERGARP